FHAVPVNMIHCNFNQGCCMVPPFVGGSWQSIDMGCSTGPTGRSLFFLMAMMEWWLRGGPPSTTTPSLPLGRTVTDLSALLNSPCQWTAMNPQQMGVPCNNPG